MLRPTSFLHALGAFTLLSLAATGCAAPNIGEGEAFATSNVKGTGKQVLEIDYQAQQTGYWCGPAASRMALSALMKSPPSQADLAKPLNTDEDGTDAVTDVVRGLNQYLDGEEYKARVLGVGAISDEQKDQLWGDLVKSIDKGHPMVANIVATAKNHPKGYPDRDVYHYIAAIGYDGRDKTVYIADSARFQGIERYELPLDQFASLVAMKGYTYVSPNAKKTGLDGDRSSVVGDDSEDGFTALEDEVEDEVDDDESAPDAVNVSWNTSSGREYSLDVELTTGDFIGPCVAVDLIGNDDHYRFKGECVSPGIPIDMNQVKAFQICSIRTGEDWKTDAVCKSKSWNRTTTSLKIRN